MVLSDGHDKSSVLKNLVNVFRRLHRIFAHAWFQHRGVFWSVEAQTGLYVLFKSVCDMYDLLPAENYKLPREAEGLDPIPTEKDEKKPTVTAIAKPPSPSPETPASLDDDRHSFNARRSNTARHSSRPSTGSAVTTVIEEREDDHPDVASRLKEMHITPPETVEEESEVEVPVIVEGDVIDRGEGAPESPPADPDTYSVKVDVQEDVPVEPDVPNASEEGEQGDDAPDDGDTTVVDTSEFDEPDEKPSSDDEEETTAEDTNASPEDHDEVSTSTITADSTDGTAEPAETKSEDESEVDADDKAEETKPAE